MQQLFTITEPFRAGGVSHMAALTVVALVALTMIVLARCHMRRAARAGEWMLAGLLLLESPINIFIAWKMNTLSLANNLPCHFCDLAAVIGAIGLITGNPRACELLYFLGIAGTVQGLLTPALTLDWPHPRFVIFFALHGGVVASALYVVIGRRQIPQSGAVMRAFKVLCVYAICVGVVDYFSGGNYGFLREKPGKASALDYLGPWPWYIASLLGVSLLLFMLLDLPMRLARKFSA